MQCRTLQGVLRRQEMPLNLDRAHSQHLTTLLCKGRTFCFRQLLLFPSSGGTNWPKRHKGYKWIHLDTCGVFRCHSLQESVPCLHCKKVSGGILESLELLHTSFKFWNHAVVPNQVWTCLDQTAPDLWTPHHTSCEPQIATGLA